MVKPEEIIYIDINKKEWKLLLFCAFLKGGTKDETRCYRYRN
jgi:hypothetical protein